MNKKAKMQMSFKESPHLHDLGGNPVEFTFITETETKWGKPLASQDIWSSRCMHLFGHPPYPDFYLSWHAQLSFNKVTTLCCHGTKSDMKPVTMTSLQG